MVGDHCDLPQPWTLSVPISAEFGLKTFSFVGLVVSGLSGIDWAHEIFSILNFSKEKFSLT